MPITVQQVLNLVMDKINQRNTDGTVDSADYAAQFPGLCDSRQAKLLMLGDLYKEFEIENKPINPIGGLMSGYDTVAFEGTDINIEYSLPCKAYSMYVNLAGTIYVEDFNGAWNTLATVTWSTTSQEPIRKFGRVTPSSGATKSRIRLSGAYRYVTKDRALFNVPFGADAQVPDYRRWVALELPADLKSVDQVIREESPEWYYKDPQYKWEGRSKLYYNYYLDGNLRVIYRPVPATITALTDVLEIDDVTAKTILPAWLAYDLYMHDNPELAAWFRREAEGLESIASVKGPASSSTMVDVYGGI